jgi:hypothetical protein
MLELLYLCLRTQSYQGRKSDTDLNIKEENHLKIGWTKHQKIPLKLQEFDLKVEFFI